MLAVAFLVLAAGGVLILTGVTDPEGGPAALLGDLLKGKAPKVRHAAGDVLEFAPALLDVPAGGGGGGAGTQTTGTSAGAGGGIVGEARRQLGKPYLWGAEGPDRFDCSGLVWWAVKRGAPMSWGRTTAEGQRVSKLGVTVSASSARAGDIVFFGIPAYHCGIYLGGGQMIHAPGLGQIVKIGPTSGRNVPVTYRRFPKPRTVTA